MEGAGKNFLQRPGPLPAPLPPPLQVEMFFYMVLEH